MILIIKNRFSEHNAILRSNETYQLLGHLEKCKQLYNLCL